MKKTTKIFFLALSVLLLASLVTKHFVQADDYTPCSSQMIAKYFRGSILSNKDIFVTTNSDEKLSTEELEGKIGDDFVNHIDDLFAEYKDMNKDKMYEFYHEKQGKLFEEAVYHGLQKKGEFQWAISPANYIVSLFKPQFKALKKTEFAPVIPSYVLGLEASLNYTVFSCTYVTDENKIIAGSRTLYPWEDLEQDKLDSAKRIIDARKIIENALSSYDALMIAYPQHVAYMELIQTLTKVKKMFNKIEAITSRCLLPNRYDAACN